MKFEDCLLAREEVLKYIDETKESKKLRELTKLSKKIFNNLYKDKHISNQNQVLLYQDDITFLDFNVKDFKEKYFIIHLGDHSKITIQKFLADKQYGNYLVLSKKQAEFFLQKAKLNSFKMHK